MHFVDKKLIALLFLCLPLVFSSGCTNWKAKYEGCEVEYAGLKGNYDRAMAQKGELSEQLSKSQQAVNELQTKIEQLKQSPAEATGFGEGYDVAFDPSAGTVTVTLQNTILFSSGKAELKKSTSTELDHIESVLRSNYSGKKIDVVGHTDSDPIKKSKWADNWQLSSERALSVVRYLIKRGTPENKIRAVGCGAARPVASNATSAGKAKNRRVEIVVYIK